MTIDAPIQYSATPARGSWTGEGETRSSDAPVFATANYNGQREAIAALVGSLRLHELRELTIDVLDTALLAYLEVDFERLRENIVDWLETADLTSRTRRQAAAIVAAREEGRAQFGTPRRGVPQERRKVPRKTR